MDNFISYRRFTTVDPNISRFGMTVEEFKISQGAPDPNPVVSPMPSSAVSDATLALSRKGSDKLRLGGPEQPAVNPYEGPKPTLVLSRNALKKLRGKVITDLQRLVQVGGVASGNVQSLMTDSLRRVAGMREYVDSLNGMAESVLVRSLAASKG